MFFEKLSNITGLYISHIKNGKNLVFNGVEGIILVNTNKSIHNIKEVLIDLKMFFSIYSICEFGLFFFNNQLAIYFNSKKSIRLTDLSVFSKNGYEVCQIFSFVPEGALTGESFYIFFASMNDFYLSGCYLDYNNVVYCTRNLLNKVQRYNLLGFMPKTPKIYYKDSEIINKVENSLLRNKVFLKNGNLRDILLPYGILLGGKNPNEEMPSIIKSLSHLKEVKFYNKFFAVERILTLPCDNTQKQIYIEDLGNIEEVASKASLFTLSEYESFMDYFYKMFCESAPKDLLNPKLVHDVYGYLVNAPFFSQDVFGIKNDLLLFKEDKKAFVAKKQLPMLKQHDKLDLIIIVYYFKEIFKFINCSASTAFIYIFVQLLSEFSPLKPDEPFRNPFIVTPFQSTVIRNLIKSLRRSLRKKTEVNPNFLTDLVKYLNKLNQDLASDPDFKSVVSSFFFTIWEEKVERKVKSKDNSIKIHTYIKKVLMLNGRPLFDRFYSREIIKELSVILFNYLEIINVVKPKLIRIKGKTPYVYDFNVEILDFLGLFTKNFNVIDFQYWPMLVQPRDWQRQFYCVYCVEDKTYCNEYIFHDSNLPAADKILAVGNDLISGGYFFNNLQASFNSNLSAVRENVAINHVNVGESLEEVLNYFQSTRLKIDDIFLQYVESNMQDCLLGFMNYDENSLKPSILKFKDKTGKFSSKRESKSDILVILSWQDFINQYAEEKYDLEMLYTNMFNEILTFFEIFFTAKLFVDFILYFASFLDFRFRIYPFGKYLTLQSSNFAKAFLKSAIPSISTLSTDEKEYCNDYYLAVEKKAIKKSSKSYIYRKLNYYNNILKQDAFQDNFVALDVNASIFQILGGLIGDEDLLEHTNLVTKDLIINKKFDFYSHINIKFLEIYDSFINLERIMALIPFFAENESTNPNIVSSEIEFSYLKKTKEVRIIRKMSVKEKEFFNSITLRLISLIKNVFIEDRQLVKQLLMTYMYSQGELASTRDLAKVLTVILTKNPELKAEFYKSFPIIKVKVSVKGRTFIDELGIGIG